MVNMQHLVTHGRPVPAQPFGSNLEGHGDDVLRGTSPDLLRRIHDPAVELIIWERSLEAKLSHWLDTLSVDQLPDDRLLVKETDLFPALTAVLDTAGTPHGTMREAFLKDVMGLVTSFMETMGSGVVDIRLETIRHDACWKFHRDCVAARLLTTYRGPGTEWVLPRDSAQALAQQTSYQGPLQHFSRHAVGLFKGSCAQPASGIVHRSPPIAGTGIARLFLCLNLPSAASPDLWTPS